MRFSILFPTLLAAVAQSCIIPFIIIESSNQVFSIQVHAPYNKTVPANIENKFVQLLPTKNGVAKAVLAPAGHAQNFTMPAGDLSPVGLANNISVLGSDSRLEFALPTTTLPKKSFVQEYQCSEEDLAELDLSTSGLFCIKKELDNTLGVHIVDEPTDGCTIVNAKVVNQ